MMQSLLTGVLSNLLPELEYIIDIISCKDKIQNISVTRFYISLGQRKKALH